jgi:colicin import membrane protein
MSSIDHGDGRRKRWLAVLLSILVHAGIVAAVGWSWWTLRAPVRAPQQLAIEATVIVQRTASAAPAPTPAVPAPTPVEPAREPAAQPQEAQRAAEQARREHEQEVAAAAAKLEAQQTAERNAQEAKEQAAKEQAAKEQTAKAQADQEQAQRVARDKAKRESELRAQLAAEERVNAARGSAEEVAWLALIRDRVTRAWIRPPSARAGVNCEVLVTQVPGGVVTGVQIGSCNGDAAVRESIQAAVYRASPLPTPSNPDLFDRNLKFNFHPDE